MARRDCLLLLHGPSAGSEGGARILSCPQLLESFLRSWTRVAPAPLDKSTYQHQSHRHTNDMPSHSFAIFPKLTCHYLDAKYVGIVSTRSLGIDEVLICVHFCTQLRYWCFLFLPCILPYEDTGDSCNVYFTHIVCLRCHSGILSLLRNDILQKNMLWSYHMNTGSQNVPIGVYQAKIFIFVFSFCRRATIQMQHLFQSLFDKRQPEGSLPAPQGQVSACQDEWEYGTRASGQTQP